VREVSRKVGRTLCCGVDRERRAEDAHPERHLTAAFSSQASVRGSWPGTCAPDETQSSALVPNTLLLTLSEAEAFASVLVSSHMSVSAARLGRSPSDRCCTLAG